MIKKMTILALLLLGTIAANACDFKFSIKDDKKSCRPGDEIEVTVELTLIHRACSVAASQTKFKTDGVKVISATEWKQTAPTKFERTVKMKVMDDTKKKISLTATRICDKEGGSGTFTLPKN